MEGRHLHGLTVMADLQEVRACVRACMGVCRRPDRSNELRAES